MISFDANILLYATVRDSPWHISAEKFLKELSDRSDVVLSELVLVEFYTGLRNPDLIRKPLSSQDATELVGAYRIHPRWRIAGFPEKSKELHDNLWREMGRSLVSRRKIFDTRLALTLIHHGVREFATVNEKDFQSMGFHTVWNPLE